MIPITCPFCDGPVDFKVSKTRKKQKPFIQMRCRNNGGHFRTFINDQDIVERMLVEADFDRS